jgi:hypothetical protein
VYLSSRANNLTGTTRTTDAAPTRFSHTLDATRRRIIGGHTLMQRLRVERASTIPTL